MNLFIARAQFIHSVHTWAPTSRSAHSIHAERNTFCRVVLFLTLSIIVHHSYQKTVLALCPIDLPIDRTTHPSTFYSNTIKCAPYVQQYPYTGYKHLPSQLITSHSLTDNSIRLFPSTSLLRSNPLPNKQVSEIPSVCTSFLVSFPCLVGIPQDEDH